MAVTPEEARGLILYQIGALESFARAHGGKLRHVKPHGALYNMAAKDRTLAEAIARAVMDFDSSLVLVGLSGSELVKAGHSMGLRCASEAFADRNYEADGSLTPRGKPGALIEDEAVAVTRVIRMVREGVVTCRTGEDLSLRADTICIHGDQPKALAFAKRLRNRLEQEGIEIRA
jgi:UPF0271 protein